MLLNCPYCEGKCNFKPIWCPEVVPNDVERPNNRIRSGVRNLIMQCDNYSCQRYIFILADGNGNIGFTYPLQNYEESKIKGLPDDITIDYIEASKCLDIRAYNATVVMCRRALQNIAIDKGAKKSDDLKDQLKQLEKKSIIKDILYNMATQIRTVGNDGAHPENIKVTEEDAREIIDITWQIRDYIYLMPQRVSDIQQRKQKNTPAP